LAGSQSTLLHSIRRLADGYRWSGRAVRAQLAVQAHSSRLGKFKQGNAAGRHANSVEEAMTARRFPTPWRVVEHPESFWVQDASGQTVGWFYFRDHPETAHHAGVLERDEARRMGELPIRRSARWRPEPKRIRRARRHARAAESDGRSLFPYGPVQLPLSRRDRLYG
jgi:hypothetical protein